MRFLAAVLVILATVAFPAAGPVPPAYAGCGQSVNLSNAMEECTNSGSTTLPTGGGTDGPAVQVYPACAVKVGLMCGRNLTCTTPTGGTGTYYNVTVNGESQGRQCIGEAEAQDAGAVTPGMVLRAMQRLSWPASTLVIQPPDGLTLVNFDTNFFTTSTTPITRDVRLLGQPITIEATPSQYHWHFDDTHNPEPLTTTEPGAAYPDLTITHNYTRKGTYQPRLDTTYTGRYRIGTGPWQTIPGTVTITGTPQQLQAIEAQPKLVGY
jgi:hypothetical protein